LPRPALPGFAWALGDAWHPTRAAVEDIKAGAAYLREVCSEQGRGSDSMMIAVRLPLKFYDGQEAAANRRPLLGGTQKIIDDICRYRDAGAQHILLDTFYSASELQGEAAESILTTMERFAAEIMPKYQD
jgi:alkanesulfonate monooxygenase SsuD/methylene tetrahydromethanopterin reductase-like flavin-dependent oxidoreductase (luciferase family)